MNIHEQIRQAHADGDRVHIHLKDGSALKDCRVAEVQNTLYVFECGDHTIEMIARSQVEHVFLR